MMVIGKNKKVELIKRFFGLIVILFAALTMDMTAYAGQWKQAGGGWWYQREDGGYPANGWNWINGKCYYFMPDGYCLINGTTPDGYQVDVSGAWVVNGNVQIQGDTSSEQTQLSEAELYELMGVTCAVYDGMEYAMYDGTETFAKSSFPVNVRAEELPSYAKASVLFWYQYFHKSNDERITEVNVKEGNYFQPYHSVSKNDLEYMMMELVGSCTDEDMNSFREHYVYQKKDGDTFLMECMGSFGDAVFFWLSLQNVSCVKENGRLKLTGTVMQVPEDGVGREYPARTFSVWFLPDEHSRVVGYRFDRLIVD